MQPKKQHIVGALGFMLLAYIAFWGVSALVRNEQVSFEEPADPTSKLATLTGQILAPDGNPPEECIATLWRRADGKKQTSANMSGKCPKGAISMKDLVAGTYLLEVGVEGAARFARNVEIQEGEAHDLGVSQLSEGGTLTVQAVAPDGRGLPGARMWLGNWLVTSDIEGRYTFAGAPAGSVMVRAQFDEVVGSNKLELEAGAIEELEVKLEDLVVRGVLGVSFTAEPEGLLVTEVSEEGPTHEVLEVGDRIVAVNGEPSLALTQVIAERRLDGPPGELLKLAVLRGEEELALEVTRADLLDVLTARLQAEEEGGDEGAEASTPDTEKTEP